MLLQLPTHSKVNSADYTVNSPVKMPPKSAKTDTKSDVSYAMLTFQLTLQEQAQFKVKTFFDEIHC